MLAGVGALLLGGLFAPLLREDHEPPRRAAAPAPRAGARVAPVPRLELAPPSARRAEGRPASPAPAIAARAAVKSPSAAAATASAPVDAAPPRRTSIAPTIEARAERAERRLMALEKREAVARRFAQVRRELDLEEDDPEAQTLRVLLGDDSPFRR